MKKTVSDEKRFIAIATVILVVISIVALFPMILLVVASFTDENELSDYKRISDFAEETQPGSIYLHGKTGSNNRKIVSCYDWNNRCRNRIKRITDDFDRISDGTKNIQI